MRLMSEEQRLKTDQLLLTSPLSVTGLVLERVAAVGVFFLTLVITGLYPWLLISTGFWPLVMIGGYIGFYCLVQV